VRRLRCHQWFLVQCMLVFVDSMLEGLGCLVSRGGGSLFCTTQVAVEAPQGGSCWAEMET